MGKQCRIDSFEGIQIVESKTTLYTDYSVQQKKLEKVNLEVIIS